MIAHLVRFALSQRLITVLMGLTLIGVGLWAFLQLKVEAYPDISDTQVVVVTQYPGRATEEVEQQVTLPIERSLNGTSRVIARRSRTIFGLSVVELTFAYGTDDYFARQIVLQKLRDADLPNGVTPTLGPLSTPIGELYRYTVQGGGLDSMKLRELQDWVISPRLQQTTGIADITPFGGLVKQYQVHVDPFALDKYQLTISQIANAISENNSNAGGALIDNRQQSMVIRGIGVISSVNDIESIVVTGA
ncbi:MAG TPA: efflux RND transporter permease subunit, partial [Bryobacteraceae bacterium]|nr:efflux RND transporter permease subunit [Bryobacteraceae bacterium]